MAICSLRFQKSFLISADGLFKITELIVGFACWALMFIGDVMANSYQTPQVNEEALIIIAITLSIWTLTCLTFLFFALCRPSKALLKVDCCLNAIFAVACTFAVWYCASSRLFVWLCFDDKGDILMDRHCEPPLSLEHRNGGVNFAVIIMGTAVAAIYLMHWIYVFVKLRMNPVLPDKDFTLDMQPMAVTTHAETQSSQV